MTAKKNSLQSPFPKSSLQLDVFPTLVNWRFRHALGCSAPPVSAMPTLCYIDPQNYAIHQEIVIPLSNYYESKDDMAL